MVIKIGLMPDHVNAELHPAPEGPVNAAVLHAMWLQSGRSLHLLAWFAGGAFYELHRVGLMLLAGCSIKGMQKPSSYKIEMSALQQQHALVVVPVIRALLRILQGCT